ncbi:MAG TPA: PQQ-binding-like beta-propeller repeat protein [Thermoflexia bacterium]|nr:PQQ-binding-like beta-propeller repeat protein [Thermoflexia bacterium]
MNRFLIRRRYMLLAILAALLLGASGCSGSSRATSWTGLTIAGDVLYAADMEQVQALDVADGEPVWAFPKNTEDDGRGVFYVTPAVDKEHVVVASQVPSTGFFSQPKNVVWALESDTGREMWRFDEAAGQYVEGGALGGGLFVIGNGDGNVYALDVESGDLEWQFETGHRVWATPLIISDTVYVGSMDRHLYALNLSDGKVRWDFHAGGAFAGTPALRNGTLYVGAFDDKFYAIDAETGTERWVFSGENWFWGGPAVYDDVIYTVDVNGNVYALDDAGKQIWREPLGVLVRAGPALTEDGSMLFVTSEDGTLYALDTADGFELWSVESEGQMFSPPVVDETAVYVTPIYGKKRILALHVDNGREIWFHPPVVEEEE